MCDARLCLYLLNLFFKIAFSSDILKNLSKITQQTFYLCVVIYH